MQLHKPHIRKGPELGFMTCAHCAKTLNDLQTRDPVFHFVFGPENHAVDIAGGKEIGRKTRRSERWGQINSFTGTFGSAGAWGAWFALSLTLNSWSQGTCAQLLFLRWDLGSKFPKCDGVAQ